MNRVAGLETEYGCLVANELDEGHPEAWPGRVKNHLFRKARAGVLDLHYRDYEEPPGNGGFLLNGGRIYLDMGHLEYASPECLALDDLVAYDLAGDALLLEGLRGLGVADRVSFLKNNIDHHTGATFGCHENYLMRREVHFDHAAVATLLAFLATRQIFTGAGRVGQAQTLAFESSPADLEAPATFQLSQRADHIVNDIYQWVQFNRAIINARDEPLADHRRYRRLHLLIGDSNMSPFATALKIGTTACVLTLLERGRLPTGLILRDAVAATRSLSRRGDGAGAVELEDGSLLQALELQRRFLDAAESALGGEDAETDWILHQWNFVLEALAGDHRQLLGGVDWLTKKWLLETFRAEQGLAWDDPWLQSLDLEYHDINPERGLFFAVPAAPAIAEYNQRVRRAAALRHPPANTRAAGRGRAVEHFLERKQSYAINWDAIAGDDEQFVLMPDPFVTYVDEVEAFALARFKTPNDPGK